MVTCDVCMSQDYNNNIIKPFFFCLSVCYQFHLIGRKSFMDTLPSPSLFVVAFVFFFLSLRDRSFVNIIIIIVISRDFMA